MARVTTRMQPEIGLTESEWLLSTDTAALLAYIWGIPGGRKHWLFACACCRSIWHLLPDTGHEIVELVERYVDGQATESGLAALFRGIRSYAYPSVLPVAGGNQAADAVRSLSSQWQVSRSEPGNFDYFAGSVAYSVSRSVAEALAKTVSWEEARSPQADLIREVFGNPFSPAAIHPSWRTWNDGTVVRLAQAIYEERAFDRMPILADALEEAGCADETILAHCRRPGIHVRGCWLVDAILGRT